MLFIAFWLHFTSTLHWSPCYWRWIKRRLYSKWTKTKWKENREHTKNVYRTHYAMSARNQSQLRSRARLQLNTIHRHPHCRGNTRMYKPVLGAQTASVRFGYSTEFNNKLCTINKHCPNYKGIAELLTWTSFFNWWISIQNLIDWL